MKKIFISIILVFGSGWITSIHAQTNSNDGISFDNRESTRFGVKAGVNFSNVYDEKGNDFVAEGKTGFAGGVFASFPLGKLIGLQPELMYSQKGFKATGSLLGTDYEFKRTTSYLDIPVLLQIKPIENFSILAGPQFSYLLSTKNDFNGLSSETEEEIDKNNYKKGIFGLVIGVEYEINNFLLSARGNWDISKTDTNGNSSDIRYKNQVIQFTVGYIF